jgi:hypothetical protein
MLNQVNGDRERYLAVSPFHEPRKLANHSTTGKRVELHRHCSIPTAIRPTHRFEQNGVWEHAPRIGAELAPERLDS